MITGLDLRREHIHSCRWAFSECPQQFVKIPEYVSELKEYVETAAQKNNAIGSALPHIQQEVLNKLVSDILVHLRIKIV